MLVTTQKIKTTDIPENACSECDGVGKVTRTAIFARGGFISECSYCNGEKIITSNLLDRKLLGVTLKEKMREKDLTIREAARLFNGEFRDWSDAIQGRNSIEDIQTKINLLHLSNVGLRGERC